MADVVESDGCRKRTARVEALNAVRGCAMGSQTESRTAKARQQKLEKMKTRWKDGGAERRVWP